METNNKEKAPQMIKLRSAYGAMNFLELITASETFAQYQLISDMPISFSYSTSDDIYSFDVDGGCCPYYVGQVYFGMELWKIVQDSLNKEIYVFFKRDIEHG